MCNHIIHLHRLEGTVEDQYAFFRNVKRITVSPFWIQGEETEDEPEANQADDLLHLDDAIDVEARHPAHEHQDALDALHDE